MQTKVKDIIPLIPEIISVKGDINTELVHLGFMHATVEKDLCTFVESIEGVKNLPPSTNILITKPSIEPDINCIIYTDYPRDVFYKIQGLISGLKEIPSIISPSAKIDPSVIISKYNVIIEEDVTIESNVVIKPNTKIGKGTIIRSGCIIGGEGFQVHTYKDGSVKSIPHKGSILIEDNVEIQQSTCIDKAIFSWDSTVIGKNTKIASLVQIAHATKIGCNNLIASGSNFGGRVRMGDHNWVGLNAVISNGIVIGNNTRVNLGSVVTKDVKDNESVSGNFAIEHTKFIENLKRMDNKNEE